MAKVFRRACSLQRWGAAAPWLGAASAVALFGCGVTRLVPAETARPVGPGSDAVFAEESGVRVKARANVWSAKVRLPEDVVALEVEIENSSAQPIHYSREDIALMGDGRALVAIDPELVVERKLTTTVGVPPTQPRYSNLPPTHPAPHQEGASSLEARRRALPDGSLASGGNARGFVYLPRPVGLSRCDLEVRIRPARGQPAQATIRIPFRIEK